MSDQPLKPCTRSGAAMGPIEVCKACGHFSIFHPGTPRPNPALTECLACTVTIGFAEVREAFAAVTAAIPPPTGIEQPSAIECTCEYPYPQGIWEGHHPNCTAISSVELSDTAPEQPSRVRRLKGCVALWPECRDGGYNSSCCRFPKSCSCTVYDDEFTKETDLESLD
jgi:hypothetical protein